ncbi:MAG: 16S rRNA (guanine(527)-N(7))-methyltransferase RsmG [Lachnospiraceae bacterium]|nr:16S rRNA (guanine(527)-N(7))-methyltransferase RsmG [Lachnospiraceae bacterium]
MINIDLKNYELNIFIKDLEELNIILNEKQLCQFMKYYELLIEWNQVMNLTAITDFDEVLKKHFIDSLSLIKVYRVNSNVNSEISSELNSSISLIDVGTGAGFPGIPLKIAFPKIEITLLDSLNKRINFLNTVIEELGLEDIEAIHGRAEDFSKKGMFREKFDLCVSRAVANLSTLSEYCLPYVKVGGKFISYKSEKITEEIASAKKAVSVLGGKIENQVEFMIPNSDIYRNLVVINKNKKTPDKYPRKAGIPAKNPIL